MIHPIELRIGNIVSDGIRYYEVGGIKEEGEWMIKVENDWRNLSEFSPYFITRETMSNFGFAYADTPISDMKLDLSNGRVLLLRWLHNSRVGVMFRNEIYERIDLCIISYLHEIQNIVFNLSGIILKSKS